jgi:3-oxoacyl-[acyl-carrier protein] reductase
MEAAVGCLKRARFAGPTEIAHRAGVSRGAHLHHHLEREEARQPCPRFPVPASAHVSTLALKEPLMDGSTRKIAIVTGASRGIGAAVARRLSSDGFNVVVNYMRRSEEAQALVDKLHSKGRRAIAVQADVSDSAAVKRLFDVTEEQFGGVDVLVNNAGVLKLSRIIETDDATVDRALAVNLKGVFNGLREAAKRIHKGGRIVSLSSSTVGTRPESYGIYVATKAAVEALTAILSKELRGRNITVNAVAPGPTATDLFYSGKSQEQIDQLMKQPPLERLGTPEDIAAVVSFLVGPDGAWVNGQVLRANGGLV